MSDAGQPPNPPPPSEPSNGDLDAAVLRSLMALAPGDSLEFRQHRLPPEKILAWIKRADRRELNGLLITALRQWHALRLGESSEEQ